MSIPILCPCSAKLRLLDSLAGLEVQCPKCLAIHPVPGPMPTRRQEEPGTTGGASAPAAEARGFSHEEQERLEELLEKGERLVWAAKPDRKGPFFIGWLLAGACFFLATVLLVIAILTFVQKLGGIISLVLGTLGACLILGGLTLPFLNRRRYERTAYALTDRRALVWDCDWLARPRFTEYGPEDLAAYTKMQFSQRPDAIGHLIFAREVTGRVGTGKLIRSHGFFYVTGVQQLEKLLRENLLDAYTDRLMG